MSDPDSDALADFYMFSDLSITELEGFEETDDYRAYEEYYEDMYEDGMGLLRQLIQDDKDSAPADEYGDQMFEALNIPEEDLGW